MVDYVPTNWADWPATSSPTSAANLNKIESALSALAAAVTALQDAGVSVSWDEVTGKPTVFPADPPSWDDVTGKPEIPSVDGLATQAAVDDLAARVDALEAADGGEV